MSSEPGTTEGMSGVTTAGTVAPTSGAAAPGSPSAPGIAGPLGPGSSLAPGAVAWGESGLVAGVVQDVADGRVLMVGWLDAEALAATFATGEVHFHSRSRGRLWRKGETSGNVLRLRTLALDCDGDALLLGVEPVGPTCHRGVRSCFDTDGSPATGPSQQGFAWLETLWGTIAERASERPAGSYTTRLLDGGVDLAGRKVAEEATEVLLAAKNDEAAERGGADRAELRALLAGEAADLIYHALVLLAERDLTPADVLAVLRDRHGRPGGR
jgi:phosphoribosyl-ATP pyrophosphohydrolase/phosphoribosyl-AMP cyclohydrolase